MGARLSPRGLRWLAPVGQDRMLVGLAFVVAGIAAAALSILFGWELLGGMYLFYLIAWACSPLYVAQSKWVGYWDRFDWTPEGGETADVDRLKLAHVRRLAAGTVVVAMLATSLGQTAGILS